MAVCVCVCAYRGRAICERLKENEINQLTCFSVSLILKHKIMLIIWEPCLCSCFFFFSFWEETFAIHLLSEIKKVSCVRSTCASNY